MCIYINNLYLLATSVLLNLKAEEKLCKNTVGKTLNRLLRQVQSKTQNSDLKLRMDHQKKIVISFKASRQ